MARHTNYAHFLRSTWQLNRLAVSAGARTLVHRMGGKRRANTWSIPYEGVLELLTLGTPSQGIDDAAQIRVPLDNAALLNRVRTARRTPVAAEFVRGEWVERRHTEHGRVVLYLHGGGYVSGSPRTHGALTAHLAQHAAARILALDYRLAPEWPFPAALEDA
ncbi:MAG: alpha/beta hydrolase fold domain-containing protein [Anaerolineales bacterium]|nr:alpha/beta hydrolase fold domain-containing protein [Anaerolineales bacterium]